MENNKVALSEDEVRVLREYKIKSDSETFVLGSIRKNFLNAERQQLEKCSKTDQELMEHLRLVAKSKGIPEDEQWTFDFETQSFLRVQAQQPQE